MNLYNERMCLWCWEYNRAEDDDVFPVRPSAWRLLLYRGEAEPGIEHICNECHDGVLKNLIADNDAEPWWNKIEVIPFTPDPPNVFVRGDRIEIIRINRPPLAGTVVHCYYSHRNWSPQVNVVIDGKKWPAVFPAHIVQKKTMVRPCPQ